jgi:hypothetical protein
VIELANNMGPQHHPNPLPEEDKVVASLEDLDKEVLGLDLSSESDPEAAPGQKEPTKQEFDWDNDPHNPYNWPEWKKALQIAAISACAFTA